MCGLAVGFVVVFFFVIFFFTVDGNYFVLLSCQVRVFNSCTGFSEALLCNFGLDSDLTHWSLFFQPKFKNTKVSSVHLKQCKTTCLVPIYQGHSCGDCDLYLCFVKV